MEEFPFTDEEWKPLEDLAEATLNASSVGDEVLLASLKLDMLELLGVLRERYGDHPVLLGTMADYTENLSERVPLYKQAVQTAEENGLPTLSIRSDYAYTLMQLDAVTEALAELDDCGEEAAAGSDMEQLNWLTRLEYAADYTDDANRSNVYRRGIEIATAHGLPTLGIRLLLIRRLLDVGEPTTAIKELRACKQELINANEDDQTWWAGMLEEASQ